MVCNRGHINGPSKLQLANLNPHLGYSSSPYDALLVCDDQLQPSLLKRRSDVFWNAGEESITQHCNFCSRVYHSHGRDPTHSYWHPDCDSLDANLVDHNCRTTSWGTGSLSTPCVQRCRAPLVQSRVHIRNRLHWVISPSVCGLSDPLSLGPRWRRPLSPSSQLTCPPAGYTAIVPLINRVSIRDFATRPPAGFKAFLRALVKRLTSRWDQSSAVRTGHH